MMNHQDSLTKMLSSAIRNALLAVQSSTSQPHIIHNEVNQRTKASIGQSDLLITSKEAARLLKMSERMLYTLQKRRAVPGCLRFVKMVRWNNQALRNWIDSGCPALPAE